MKVGLVQTNIYWECKEKNIANAENIISEYTNSSIQFMLFPEMSFTGFSMNTDITGEKARYTVGRVSQIAQKYSIGIGFGWVRWGKEKCENVYSVVGRDGSLISEYVKIHPFSYSGENKRFIGGNRIIKYDLFGIPMSTFLCYDLRFPELFRAVCEDVSVIIIPANWPAKRSDHWKTLLKARAIENQVYILGVNCCGDIGQQHYSGDSCVINPEGEVLEIMSEKEGVLIHELNNDVLMYREKFPVLRDCRKDFYKLHQ